MAAIPDAGGARCAPRGALRALPWGALPWGALLRVAVLGGLVITGWLLGSGIGQAQEDLAAQDLRQQDNIVRLVGFPLPDDDSGGLIGAPPAVNTVKSVTSRATDVLRAVPRLPIRPPQVPVLAPVLDPVSKLAAPAPVTRSHVQPQPTLHRPVMVVPPPAAPAEPAVRAATVVVTPIPMQHASPVTLICTAADPLADQAASSSAEKPLGSDPTAPAAPSPFGTTTAPCSSGSTGGGGVTSSAQNVTLGDRSSGMDPASTYRLLGADLSGMPLAAAQRPSTSPD